MTFGSRELLRGFAFLIAVIGLFGIGEILVSMERGLAFRGAKAEDQPLDRAPDLGQAGPLLGDCAARAR